MSSISKRFWALLLAASMVFSMMAMSVSATEQDAEPEVPEVEAPIATPEAPAETTEGAVPDDTQFLTTGIEGMKLWDYTMYPESNGEWVTEGNDTYYRYTWEEKIRWTAIFGDGTELPMDGLFSGKLPLGDSVYTMECLDTQQEEHWQPGGTYEVQVVLKNLTLGTECSDTATVKIQEATPLVSFTVEPITIYEGQYRDIHQEGYTYYNLRNRIRYTAEFANGELVGPEYGDSLCYDDECYEFVITSDQSADNIWGVGEHTLRVSVWGQTVDVPVTILESPVTSLTVNPIYLVEGQKRSMAGEWDGEQYKKYLYYDWRYDLTYQITYADGSVVERSHSNSFCYNNEWYDLLTFDHQKTESWTVGNTYTVTVSAFGAETQTTVTIVENPIASIVMDPVTVYTGVDDYETYDWVYDEASGLDQEVYYRRYEWYDNMGYTVVYRNGDSEHMSGSCMEYMGVNYPFSYEDGQSWDHTWEQGNSYTFSVHLMDAEATQLVTVSGSPVTNISFEPIVLTEGQNGYLDETEDGKYYHYNWEEYLQYTVYFADGTSAVGNQHGFEFANESYYPQYENPQGVDAPWEASGTYMVDITIMGMTSQVAITIMESPLERVEIKPITFIEENDGYWDYYKDMATGESVAYYRYGWYDKIEYTLYFKDSAPVTGSGTSYYHNGQWYYFSYGDSQYQNPWTAGNTYQEEVYFMGRQTQVQISIKESPLQSITLTPLTMLENTGGWTNTDEGWDDPAMNGSYYYYNWANQMQATLTFKDRSVTIPVNSSFDYDGNTYNLSFSDNQNYANRWLPNTTHTVTVEAMGQMAQSQVTIAPLEVKSLRVEPIMLRENQDGWWNNAHVDGNWVNYYFYSWTHKLNYQVEMADGTLCPGYGESFNYMGQSINLVIHDTQSSRNPWYAGTHEVQVSVGGVSAPVYITVASVQQENEWMYMVQNDMAFITGCYSYSSQLYVPETLGGYPVVGINTLGEAQYHVRHLFIPDSVTMLSEYVFCGEGGCEQLRSVTFGSGVGQLNMDMFQSCKNLEAIEVSPLHESYYSEDGVVYDKGMTKVVAFPLGKTGTYYLPETVTDANVIFDNLGQLQVRVEFDQVNGYKKQDGVVYNEDMTVIYSVDQDKTGDYVMPDSVGQIKRFAFANSQLTSVTVSQNVTDIVYYTFYNSAVQTVTLPDSVTTIEIGAFEDCSSLTSLNMPSALKTLGSKAFANTGLTSVTLPASLQRVGDKAFRGSSLQQVTLPENLQSIGYEAFAYTDLQQITIPNSVTELGDGAFIGCYDLESVTLSNQLTWIPSYAFAETAITEVTIPDSVEFIHNAAFVYCYQLTDVTLGKNVVEVGYEAFAGCPITQLDLGESLQTIATAAFKGARVQTLELPQTVTEICYLSFGKNPNLQSVSLPDSLQRIHHLAFVDTGWYDAQPDGHLFLDGFYYDYKGIAPVGTVLYLPEDIRGVAENAVPDGCLEAVIFTGDAPIGTTLYNTDAYYPADNETWTAEARDQIGYGVGWMAAVASGSCGDNAYWVLDPDGLLKIIGYGSMYDYAGQNTPWQAYNSQINSVWVSGRIDYVGDYAFADCGASTVTFVSDAPAFGQNVFSGMTATVNYPTACEGWEDVVTSQHGGVITWHLRNDVYASGTCGDLNWRLDYSGTLTISGNGYMQWSDWYNNPGMIKRIILEEGVQSIYDGAFQNLQNLEKVVISSTVEYIGCSAFANCMALKQVTIPKDGAMYRIGAEAFRYCESLSAIALPEALQKVESYVFSDCINLKEVDMPSQLNEIEWDAFYNCQSLEQITIPNGVTSLGGEAFYDCFKLSLVQLPMTVQELGYDVFHNCISLKSIELPESLTTINGNAFFGTGLQSITIPANVTNVELRAFRFCEDLTEVIFTGAMPCIADTAFDGVTATVYYPGEDPSWEQAVGNHYGGNLTWVPMFDYVSEGVCGENLTWHLTQDGTLIIKGSGAMDDYGANSAPWSGYKSQIVDVQMDGVTYVGDHAFYDCTELRRISAESLTAIGYGSFRKCTNLWNVSFDNLQSVGCYAFAGCTQLRDFDISVQLQNIGDYAFQGCTALHAIYFNGTPELGKYVFQGCTGLKLVDLGYSTYVSDGMFAGCVGLDTVYMSREMTEIGDEAFMYCEELDTIYLHKNVSYIGDFAFFGCRSLNSLQLPDSVTYVGSYAMHNCENLNSVIFQGDAPEFGYKPLSGVSANIIYFENTQGWSDELISSLGGSGNVEAQTKTVVSVFRNGSYMAAYETMEEALAAYDSATDYLHVSYDIDLDISLDQDLYLNLNGNDLTGVIRTNGHKIYGVDSATDYYYCDAIGYMNCTDENGQMIVPERHVQMTEAVYGKIARYMAIETNRGWTFHRFYMGITHNSLKPANTGMGFKAVFYGDEMVMSVMDSIGYSLQLEGGKKMQLWKRADQMESGKQVSLRIQNWDIAGHGQTQLYAQVCLQLFDGTVIETGVYETTMRQQVESMNAALEKNPNAYTGEQITAVKNMLANFADAVKDWVVDVIQNAIVAVDPALFDTKFCYTKYELDTVSTIYGEMEGLHRTVLDPWDGSIMVEIYIQEPYDPNVTTISYGGQLWYAYAGGGDGVSWQINGDCLEFTDGDFVIRCQLCSDGSLKVVSGDMYLHTGDVLTKEAQLLRGLEYVAWDVGSFHYWDDTTDLRYDEAVYEYGLSFDGGTGGCGQNGIYLPDTAWADPSYTDISSITFNGKNWYQWGGGMGDDHSYRVVGDQIFINPCDDASMQMVCQLQSDGGIKVVSSQYGIIPEGVVFYPVCP